MNSQNLDVNLNSTVLSRVRGQIMPSSKAALVTRWLCDLGQVINISGPFLTYKVEMKASAS